MADVYDAAIAYLRDGHMDQIQEAWMDGGDFHPAHCLFLYATASGTARGDLRFGCLTTIRSIAFKQAETQELTEAIMNDSRIPRKSDDIKEEDLPVFAEWQRRLDKELGRKVPKLKRKLEPYMEALTVKELVHA